MRKLYFLIMFFIPGILFTEEVNISFIKDKPLIIKLERVTEKEFKGRINEYEIIVEDRNKDGKPDIKGDRWIFYKENRPIFAWSFSEGRFYLFKLEGKDPKVYKLEEYLPDILTDIPEYLLQLQGRELKEGNNIYPSLIIDDWCKKGKFLEGNLIEGGYITNGRVIIGNRYYEGYDLDDDGDIDIIRAFTERDHALFDFRDEMKDELKVPLKYPNIDVSYPDYYHYMREKEYFSKTFLSGRIYKGALRGFEEHIFIKERPSELFKTGAQFFICTLEDTIRRMTMGGLSNEGNLNWNIELGPLAVSPGQGPTTRICEYRDKCGHFIRFTSCIYPENWDGRRLEFSKIIGTYIYELFPDGPWYKITTGKYFKLYGTNLCITNEGDYFFCDEGMYGGSLTWKERIEASLKKPSFTLYYSSLMGGLHLKHADFGYKAYPLGYNRGPSPFDYTTSYHKEGLELPARFIGIRTLDYLEGKRFEGPTYLCYEDRDKDGYFDTYLLDIDNDGIFEKALYYFDKLGFISLVNKGYTSIFPYKARFEEVDYQMQNYDRIKELYRRGYLEEPLIERAEISSSGKPILKELFYYPEGTTTDIKFPSTYITIENGWKNRFTLLNLSNSPDYTWTNFGINGFVSLGTHLTKNEFEMEEINNLEGIKDKEIIFIPNLDRFLKKKEIDILLKWVKEGGLLIINVPEELPEKIYFFNGFGKFVGYEIIPEIINKRSVRYKEAIFGNWGDEKAPIGEERAPGIWNRIDKFKGEEKILKDLNYISFVGYPIKTNEEFKPLVMWEGKILISEKSYGKGKIIISGINCFSNKYLIHPQFYEPLDNYKFLENIILYIKENLRLPFEYNILTKSDERILEMEISGNGGKIIIPDDFSIFINGEKTSLIRRGRNLELVLEKGKYRIKIEKKEKK
jgi:hypothetical protein